MDEKPFKGVDIYTHVRKDPMINKKSTITWLWVVGVGWVCGYILVGGLGVGPDRLTKT